MSVTIPGGRQRSSSEGDILEEGFYGAFKSSKSSNNVKEASDNNKLPGRVFAKHHNKVEAGRAKTLSKHPECDEDNFGSDGGISSHSSYASSKSKKRTRRLSFKSMRKAVSRAFVKEGKGIVEVDQNAKTLDVNGSGKIWTPDLRHLGKGQSNMIGMDSPRTILSSARPLITDPDLGMTIPKWKRTPGTTGIANHSNSCFMNAVLQCLSNTDSFTEYFIEEFHKRDLKQNKNGKKTAFRSSHGEVTELLSHLLSSLWCGKYHSDISKNFKAVVAKVNSQYHGDDQHDSQEFLLWLLDRIHEDVCNVLKKKKAQKSLTPKSDEELAQEALAVNGESFIVKLFKALHSSTLTCPSCGDRSRTFDPYLCVSLPLPQRSPRLMFINVVFLEQRERCVKIALVLNHYDIVRDLRESVSAEVNIPFKQIILCQLTNEGFGATYSNEQALSDISDNETVYAIETDTHGWGGGSPDNQFDSPSAQVLVLHVEQSENSSYSRRFGSPCLLKLNRDIKWKDLQREMLYQLDDAVYREIFPQKLSNLFQLQVWDGSSKNGFLPKDVEMPLFTQAAERALDLLDKDFGPLHIKLLAIWNHQTKNKVIQDDREFITEDPSVRDLSANPPSQDTVSLDECFKLYTQEEKLIGEDAWMCPHCKQLQQGTVKSLGLWSLPDILILHLKRFKQTGLRRSKLNTLVEFPVDNFDMSPHLTLSNKKANHNKSDDSTYDLIGVCNHYGNMMGGHYTAFCRSPVDGKWREFNDTKVRCMEGSPVAKEAYILFYQRRSLSKDINQKLFTGDHWVFSLPLAEEEKESSSAEVSPRDEETVSKARKNRSRSTSPALRRQSNGPTKRIPLQPSTPQPTKRPPVLSYYDNDNNDDAKDTHSPITDRSAVRQSRPLQRQLSSGSTTIRREKSASKVKSPTRGLYERRNDAEDASFAPSKITSKVTHKDEAVNTTTKSKDPIVSVIRHSKDNTITSSVGNEPVISVDKHPRNDAVQSSMTCGLLFKNDKSNQTSLNSNSIPTSSTLTYRSDSSVQKSFQRFEPNTELEADSKYPKSLHLPSSHTNFEKHRVSRQSSYSDEHKVRDNFQMADKLQVKMDSFVSPYNSSSQASKSHDLENTSHSGEARRKLAELMRQNSFEKQNGHAYDSKYTTRTLGRNFSIEQSKRNPVCLDHLSEIDDLEHLDIRGRDEHGFSSRLKMYQPEDYRSHDPRDRLSYPPSHGEGEYFTYSDGAYLDSSLRSRVDDAKFMGLAQHHFGDPHPSVDSYRYQYTNESNDSSLLYQKCATIARSREISPPHHSYDSKDILSVPRSSTDQNISYRSGFHQYGHKFAPLKESEINAILSYDISSRQHSSSTNPRMAPSYVSRRYGRIRPRGVWGVNPPKPSKTPPSQVPTPCLRESAV